jgi:hypothetical protein
MVAQIISLAAGSVPGIGNFAAGQHLVDQFFQALARVTAGDGVTPLLLSPAPGDSSDGFSGEDVGAFSDTALPTIGAVASRTRSVTTPPETPLQQPRANQVALDQVFAETAEETAWGLSDE